MTKLEGCRVQPAQWPDDLGRARTLLRHYQTHLLASPAGMANICLDGYDGELAELDRRWGPPNAVFLLAVVDNVAGGCAAVRLLHDRPHSAELKRMWVEPGARGRGAGRALAMAAVAWAQGRGASELLLDTVPAAMPEANRLYAELGFAPYTRYNDNPVDSVVFFRRPLGG